MTEKPSEANIESLVEQIDARPWTVLDYDFEGGYNDPFEVTLELKWVGSEVEQQDRRAVYSVVQSLDAEHDDGAPLSAILDRCEETAGIDPDRTRDLLEQLRRVGDVYEPTTDHLRVV